MKRLTKKEPLAGRNVFYVGEDDCFDVWSVPKKFMGNAIDRLALIEDILGEDYDLDRLKVLLSADAEAAIHIGTCEFCEHYTFDKFCCCPAWVEEGDVIRRGAHDYCSKFKKASWVDGVWGENGCPSCPGYKPEKAEQEE